MRKIRESRNAIRLGWGYDKEGQLIVFVPHFSRNDEYLTNCVDDDRITAYLHREHCEYLASDYDYDANFDEFIEAEEWSYDLDIYKLVDGKLIEIGDSLTHYDLFRRNDILLNDSAYNKGEAFLNGEFNIPTEFNLELKVGDLRYDTTKDEIVLIVPAPKYLYDKDDEPDSLVVIMSFHSEQLVSFKDKSDLTVIVLDQDMLNADNVKNKYPLLISRRPDTLIK